MNKFSEQLLQAFEVAMDEKISTLRYDTTVQATITKIENVDTGEYRVKYQGGEIIVYATDPTEEFKVGDSVYVTVPEGDFTNKKFISHKLTNNSISASQYSELSNTIIEVSPNFSELGFQYTSDEWGLKVGEPDNEIDVLNTPIPDAAVTKFQAFASKYEYIQIKASFKTQFIKDPAHTRGDYGVCVGFESVDTDTDGNSVIIPYFLNIKSFNGDPYHLYSWSPQSIVIKIPKNQIQGISYVKFYETGFLSDSDFLDNDLFMKDFSLSFVKIVDLTNEPYYPIIIPHGGTTFVGDNDAITLEGKIIHYGMELQPESCIYKWFKRDLSVVAGTQAYDKRVGPGWIFLGEEIEGSQSNVITVTSTDVPGSQKYRLLMVYNSDTILIADIELAKAALDVTIEQKTENNQIFLFLSQEEYLGDWYCFAEGGDDIHITEEGATSDLVNITGYLLYSPMTFYCQVYKDGIYYGELHYVMQNMESKDDVSVVFVGETIFSYDANGDIKIDDAENIRSLTAEIVFNKGIISSSCDIKWLDYLGNTIDQNYKPDESMMFDTLRVDQTGKILYYTVKSKFKLVPSKYNTVKVEISTLDGQVYSFDKEIIFTKTGDPGTNGTKYQVLVSCERRDASGHPIGSLLVNNDSVVLTGNVYKDGIKLRPAEAEWDWDLHNLSLIIGSNNSISVALITSGEPCYAKLTTTIEGTTIYSFIPVHYTNSDDFDESQIDLSSLPKYVQYAANGRNPQYLRGYIGDEVTVISGDVSIVSHQLKFADEFVPEHNTALLKVSIEDAAIFYTIPMYINTYGNEDIDGWDGVELDIDGEGQYIYAPQVGAGIKNSDNTFTGVVMGKDPAQNCIGLYGYGSGKKGTQDVQGGVNTFGLRADGVAYFGTDKGKITIDGQNATIVGGPKDSSGKQGGDTANGMTINLYNQNEKTTYPAIKIGNGNFLVNYGGIVTAKGATIDGNLYALYGKIGGTTKSSTDGWAIETHKISSGSGTGYVELNSNINNTYTFIAGNTDPIKAKFSVTREGVITARGATIKGDLYAKSGRIGCTINEDGTLSDDGWIIDSKKIYRAKNKKYVALSTQGNYAIYAGSNDTNDSSDSSNPSKAPFWVKFDGSMKASSATITGTITANTGKIGGSNGWNITTNKMYSGNVCFYSGTDSNYKYDTNDYYRIWAGSSNTSPSTAKFYVTNTGIIKATKATITGTINAENGYIGWVSDTNKGWEITANTISSNAGTGESGNSNVKYIALSSKDIYAIWAGNQTPSSAPFSVTHQGKLKAVSAEIGNWTINSGDDGALRSTLADADAKTRIYLNGKPSAGGNVIEIRTSSTSTDGQTAATNGRFYVTDQGKMYAENAEIHGTIKSKAGEIGEWNIASGRLYSGQIGLSSSGITGYTVTTKNNKTTYTEITDGKFVIWSGAKYSKGADTDNNDSTAVNGTENALYLRGSSFFGVTSTGKMYCRAADVSGKITATSGAIGNWSISSGSITNGTTTLSSTGGITCSNADISGYINATSGSIGSWSISGGSISAGGTILSSNGLITLNGSTQSTLIQLNGSATGTLGFATGSTGDTDTKLVSLYSSQGLLLTANGGGCRIVASNGFYVDIPSVNGDTNEFAISNTGRLIISSKSYGDSPPETENIGTIYFQRVTEEEE